MTKPEILPLTGLRGLLALWIVVLHITVGLELAGYPVAKAMPGWLANFLHAGPVAVDGFFLLSGFILSHTYAAGVLGGGAAAMLRFLQLRLARLYPVHLAVLAAYGIAVLAAFPWRLTACGNPANRAAEACDRFSAVELAEHLLLTASWRFDNLVGWNTSAWSISSEWFVYLCFPLFALVVSRTRPSLALPLAGAVLAAMLVLLFRYAPIFHGVGDDYSLIRVIPEFFAGCLIHRAFAAGQFSAWPMHWIALGAVALSCLCIMTGIAPMVAAVSYALIIPALAGPRPGPLGQFLATPRMVWLGRISYPLYMTNLLTIELAGALTPDSFTADLVKSWYRTAISYGALVLLCIGIAYAVHVLIEEPARRRLRRWIDG